MAEWAGARQTLEVEACGPGESGARVWLARPHVRNAFDATLISELTETIGALSEAPDVRAIVLAGRGESFCAGADLKWMRSAADWTAEENREDAARLATMLRVVAEAPKPVIARIHGGAFGGGVGLAAAADICLVGPNALFSLSEVKLGLSPATIGPHVLEAMGPRAARRYWLTAERFGPEEATRIGLAHDAFTDDAAMDAAIEALLKTFAENGPRAMAATKALIRTVASRPNDAALDAETAALIADLRVSPEAQEGLAAFFDKRPPSWRA